MTGLVGTDRGMFAAEFTSAVSASLWAVFDRVNVDDNLSRAYKTRWPDMADDHSLYEQWRSLAESGHGVGHNEWFFNGLKGQLAEFEAQELLEAKGFTNVKLAPIANQESWDISAISPAGRDVTISVKTGTSYSTGDVQGLMEGNPDHLFALSAEIHQRVVESGMETGDRIVAVISPDYERVTGIQDGLEALSANMGIDIPDGVVDILPYALAITVSARLIYSALKTEREFKAADRSTKNKIQVVQTLTLMSKMGVTTVLTTAGAMGGAAAGSFVAGIGNVAASAGGMVIGAGVGMYLNKHLQPHMLDLALNITGLTRDDLFYYKNKQHIDDTAWTFQDRAARLAATPGF